MRSFNDWYFDLFESGNGACLNQQEIAEEAWDYQQSKVDELQKRVDSTLKVVQSMRKEVKHGHMSDEEAQMLSSFAYELEQALKGGGE